MRMTWPDVRLEVWHVYMLGKAVQSAGIEIEYRTLQPFITEGMYRIQKAFVRGDLKGEFPETTPEGKDQVERLEKIANKTDVTVRRILRFAKKTPIRTYSEDEDMLLSAVKNKL